MTSQENALIANAQAAYQEAFAQAFRLNYPRTRRLFRLGLVSLLQTELEAEHEDIDHYTSSIISDLTQTAEDVAKRHEE